MIASRDMSRELHMLMINKLLFLFSVHVCFILFLLFFRATNVQVFWETGKFFINSAAVP
jgi:hypothetical protein